MFVWDENKTIYRKKNGNNTYSPSSIKANLERKKIKRNFYG